MAQKRPLSFIENSASSVLYRFLVPAIVPICVITFIVIFYLFGKYRDGVNSLERALLEAERAIQAGQFRSALAKLQGPIKEYPHVAKVHYLMGLAYKGLGDKKMALFHLRKCLSLATRPVATIQLQLRTIPPLPEKELWRRKYVLGTDSEMAREAKKEIAKLVGETIKRGKK
ncbi:MAG: hypothetical protein NZ959_09965 [Armatimonadetes bacterium]|nr:hypothetical protein [Armatimonadota bacterium]MDW8123097.1 hypothetical protein [Armatimonadota bacterium]